MGGPYQTHVMCHSTHDTDITGRVDVCGPSCRTQSHNLIHRESRYLNEERQHSSDTQRGRWHARDEEHFSLRDEANARTQLLQKIPLCERLASLEVTHREDQGLGQGKEFFRLCRFKKDSIVHHNPREPRDPILLYGRGCRFR